VDAVLLVAVCVGFGGQCYITETDARLRRLAALRKEKGFAFEIQVDGGINLDNALEKHRLGADTLVAGSMVFLSGSIHEVVKKLKNN
jgi:ribulose-phosphate 3-epimerase